MAIKYLNIKAGLLCVKVQCDELNERGLTKYENCSKIFPGRLQIVYFVRFYKYKYSMSHYVIIIIIFFF